MMGKIILSDGHIMEYIGEPLWAFIISNGKISGRTNFATDDFPLNKELLDVDQARVWIETCTKDDPEIPAFILDYESRTVYFRGKIRPGVFKKIHAGDFEQFFENYVPLSP